jgi:hypothetical protein
MSKLLSFVFGISFIGIAAAQATPFHSAHARFIIPVASGCGIGVHRGPYDGCEPIYGGYHRSFYRGYYHGYNNGYHYGYYDEPGRSLLVDQGNCSGRGNYLVCNAYGVCWAACYGLNGMPAD